MIVEFIGSTGAGKSTLIRDVQRKLAQTVEVTTAFDLAAAPLGLQRVTHTTLRNLVQEAAGFPFFVGSLWRNKAFVGFALRMLARQAELSVLTLNNLRSLERKVSMYEINRRRRYKGVVLVDEGTVLAAHNLFVYSSAFYTREEIQEFAALVPLPDVIVYVRAPIQNMVDRSLRRSDPPRELKSKDPVLVEKAIARAVAVFDQVIQSEKIRSRVLSVENPDSAGGRRDVAVNTVAEFLLERHSAMHPAPVDGIISVAGVSPEHARHVN